MKYNLNFNMSRRHLKIVKSYTLILRPRGVYDKDTLGNFTSITRNVAQHGNSCLDAYIPHFPHYLCCP